MLNSIGAENETASSSKVAALKLLQAHRKSTSAEQSRAEPEAAHSSPNPPLSSPPPPDPPPRRKSHPPATRPGQTMAPTRPTRNEDARSEDSTSGGVAHGKEKEKDLLHKTAGNTGISKGKKTTAHNNGSSSTSKQAAALLGGLGGVAGDAFYASGAAGLALASADGEGASRVRLLPLPLTLYLPTYQDHPSPPPPTRYPNQTFNLTHATDPILHPPPKRPARLSLPPQTTNTINLQLRAQPGGAGGGARARHRGAQHGRRAG